MTQYTVNKQKKFVELLYKKTLERGIKWALNDGKQIYATVAGRSLFVYSSLNNEGEELIHFAIFGTDSKISDSFTDETIKYGDMAPAGFDNWYLLCSALLDMGKRQASGADDALDAMIDELDDDVPF
jgi:hypothetical protein